MAAESGNRTPLINEPPHIYSSVGFDRAAERRNDSAWLEVEAANPENLLLPVHGLKPRIDEPGGQGPVPVLLPMRRHWLEKSALLGRMDGRTLFMADLGDEIEMPGDYVELRSVGSALPAREAGYLALARALSHWHTRHKYCGACGQPTEATQAGHARLCDDCGLEVFPRTDPAVIILVTNGDHALLGRSRHFIPGMYSTLAGFVEAGESLEQAVEREIFEEVGLKLSNITYRSSQPWPFPQSLMLGFRAEAHSRDLVIDPVEIEDAMWVAKDVLKDEKARPVRLPSGDSIARYLIEQWLDEDDRS